MDIQANAPLQVEQLEQDYNSDEEMSFSPPKAVQVKETFDGSFHQGSFANKQSFNDAFKFDPK